MVTQRRIQPDFVNIIMLAVVSLLASLQILIIVAFIFSFIPMPPSAFLKTLFEMNRAGAHPEREMLFYRVFVFMNIAIQAGSVYWFRDRLDNNELTKKCISWIRVEIIWIFLQLFAFFKMVMYPDLAWPKYFFYVVLGLVVISKIFLPESRRWTSNLWQKTREQNIKAPWIYVWDIVFLLLIGFLVFMPDLDGVLARIFAVDQFYHIDNFIMSSAWAWAKGGVLNLDQMSSSGVVLPAVVAQLAKMQGGLSYQHVVVVLIFSTMVYAFGFYGLLRAWLGSVLLASFGMLLALKFHLYHTGVSPLVWVDPQSTAIRYLFDLAFLWCVLKHLSGFNKKYLWAAAICSGIALAYMPDTGACLMLVFFLYLSLLLLIVHYRKEAFVFPRDLSLLTGCLLFPFLIALFIMWLFTGNGFWSSAFWSNWGESANLHAAGWGALPLYDGLRDRNFFAFLMGFVIPTVYLWTIIVVGAQCFLNNIKRSALFIVVVSLYGLAMFHSYIVHSSVSGYYAVCFPFVMVICFWVQQSTQALSKEFRRITFIALFVLSLGGLLTNTLFIYYPNALNLSGMDLSQEKNFYKEQFVFDEDAAFIRQLTTDDERVALISSFETKILMAADRRPFFYYFPLFISHVMGENVLAGTNIFTTERMQKTLSQLESQKPRYLFIEKRIVSGGVPKEYYQYFQTISLLLQYVQQAYEPYEQGKYLVVLKRK